MTLRRRTVLAAAVVGLASVGYAASARAADVPTHVIAANVNDPGIDPTRGSHHVWLASDPARRVGKLLVFMGGGGATNLPQDWSEMGTEAGRLGYHAIVLAYANEAPVAALPPVGCGNSVDPPESPPNCAFNARMEILDGRGESTVVNVDRANSIENRLTKVLQHLATTYAGEGWSQFLDTGGLAPRWSQTVIAGQSLGAAQAVLIGMQYSVDRVAAFAGWADAKHGWVKLSKTASSRHFTLNHQREGLFERTCFAYVALSLAQGCPLANVSLVDNRQPPFGTSQLVHNLEPFTLDGVNDPYLTSTTRDGWIAREADGTPSKKLLDAWRSVLGDSDGDGRLDHAATGTVGGSVPATLSLTLGSPAGFGAFTPGVARDYTASMTANVISSAANAALSIADPSATATGRLVNGAFSLPSTLQAKATSAAATGSALANVGGSAAPTLLLTYANPIANNPVTIDFSQHVGAADALRTGPYSKTLTFTLSTTAP